MEYKIKRRGQTDLRTAGGSADPIPAHASTGERQGSEQRLNYVHDRAAEGFEAVNIGSALGARVVAVDLDTDALDLAEQVGADVRVDAAAVDDVSGAVADVTDGGADVSVDALGIAETCQNSLTSLAPQGQHIQVGMTTDEEAGEIALPVDAMVDTELEFVGVKRMPPQQYDELFAMIATDRLAPAALVTNRVALDDISDRLRSMDEYDTLGLEVATSF